MLITEKFFEETILPPLRKYNRQGMAIKEGASFFTEIFTASAVKPPKRPFEKMDAVPRKWRIKQLRKWLSNGMLQHLSDHIPILKQKLLIVINAYKNGIPEREIERQPTIVLVPEAQKDQPSIKLLDRNKRGRPKTNKPLFKIPPPFKIPVSDKWALAKELLSIPANACRYPIENTFCKKEQKDGSSYCVEHFRICRVQIRDFSI